MSDLQRGGRTDGPLFAARYPGECGFCSEPFDEGDGVRYDADGLLVGFDCGCGDPYYAD